MQVAAWILELFFVVDEDVETFGETGREGRKEVKIDKFLDFFIVQLESHVACNEVQLSLPNVDFSGVGFKHCMHILIVSDFEIVG